MWNPEQYHRYSNERNRPFFDLLSQVGLTSPGTIVDLGCGSGELTATMAERWPGARVHGVDSSPEMIAAADPHAIEGRLTFEVNDLRRWRSDEPVDLLVSNAALQWVGDHESLLPELVGMVAVGGVLAFQVPGNFDAPSHAILAELCSSEQWEEKLGADAFRGPGVLDPARYLEMLIGLGLAANVWETTYLQVLEGEDAVLEWVKGTALRPVIAALEDVEREEFMESYRARLREAYPRRAFGTVFPFRRIFAVAAK